MKMNIFTSDTYIKDYLAGDYDYSLQASTMDDEHTCRFLVGTAEVTFNNVDLRQVGIAAIEENEQKARAAFEAKMQEFSEAKQKFLAIESDESVMRRTQENISDFCEDLSNEI